MRFHQSLVSILILALLGTLLLPPYAARATGTQPEEFADIKGHWAEKEVLKSREQGVAKGYPDGMFRPGQSVSRAEFVTFVNRRLNLNPRVYLTSFEDIYPDDWYAKDVAIGRKAGYIAGYNGHFRPKDPISREEAAVVLGNLLKQRQPETGKESGTVFKDSDQFAVWSSASIEQASRYGLVDGLPDGTFQPKRPITRAESIVILERHAELFKLKSSEEIDGNVYLNPDVSQDAPLSEGKPLLAITSPSAGLHAFTPDKQITLGGFAQARTIKSITYTTDDGRSGSASGGEQWEIPGLMLDNEETVVTVTLTDEENRTISDTMTLIRDMAAPVLSLSPVHAGDTIETSDPDIEISGTASDNDEIKLIRYKVKYEDREELGEAFGTVQWAAVIPLAFGKNEIEITGVDRAGNSTSKKLQVVRNHQAAFQQALQADKEVVFAGGPTEVRFTIPVQAGDNSPEVKLVQVLEDGSMRTIAMMNDNGSLYHGDDLDADGVFSARATLDAGAAGRLVYKAVVDTGSGKTLSGERPIMVVNKSTGQEHEAFVELGEQARVQWEALSSTSSSGEEEKASLVAWLKARPDIADAGLSAGGGSIWYVDRQGFKGALLTRAPDVKGAGQASAASAAAGTATGTMSAPVLAASTNPPSAQVTINSANVLIASPFASKGLTAAAYDEITDAFKGSLGYYVNRLKDEAVTVETFKKLGQYGVIILDTHGELLDTLDNGIQVFLTGQKVTAANIAAYEADMKSGKLIEMNGYYGITPAFINAYNRSLPGSIVFNGSCLSSLSESGFSQAFLDLGAKTYLGYEDAIEVKYDQKLAKSLFLPWIKERQTIGKAYDSVRSGSLLGKESLKLSGSGEVVLRTELSNTSFEEEDLADWITEGDVRILSKLGPIAPSRGKKMALLSTGLGSVDHTDSAMERVVTIPSGAKSILFDYNVVSEEPMEWLDTHYDDEFQAVLETADGQKKVLKKTTVSAVADWEAVPAVNLDGGDDTAYQSGWSTANVDVSGYADRGPLQIRYKVWDRGDTDYDTVVLLDNIQISYLAAVDPTDGDEDGLPDEWEKKGIRIGYNGEYRYTVKTNPNRKDTDGDGLNDGAELLYLQVYQAEDGGFFEVIDHPASDAVSLFARDIYADLGSILDLKATTIAGYKANIVKAEQYKMELLAYSNRIMNNYYDLRSEDRRAFLTYLEEIRAFVDGLNQVIASYAESILSSTDEEAKLWLIESNISLFDSEFGEGIVANPLLVNRKIGIERYVDTKVYNDEGPVGEGFDPYTLMTLPSEQLRETYAAYVKQLPITPYESYEYVMNEPAFDQLIGYMDGWWRYSGSKVERDKAAQYTLAIGAVLLRNNPCSYIPNGCGEGTAVFETFYDRYFYIQYKDKKGRITHYVVEPDLGILPKQASKPAHVTYTLIEPETGRVSYIGRTANPAEKAEAIRSHAKFLGLEWKELYRGPDYNRARAAEQAEIDKYKTAKVKPKLLIGVRQMTEKNQNIAKQLQSIREDLLLKKLTGEEEIKKAEGYATKRGLFNRIGQQPSKKGWVWHFIIPEDIALESKIKATQIYNTYNVVALPEIIHNKVKAHFNSSDYREIPVKSNLKGMNYAEKKTYGKKAIQSYGTLIETHTPWTGWEFVLDGAAELEQMIAEKNEANKESQIREMQKLLKDNYGLYKGEVTGKYNIGFLYAIVLFQNMATHELKYALDTNGSCLVFNWFCSKKISYKVDGNITEDWINYARNGMVQLHFKDLLKAVYSGKDPTPGLLRAQTIVGVGEGLALQVMEDGVEVLMAVWSLNIFNVNEKIEQIKALTDAIQQNGISGVLGDMWKQVEQEYVDAFTYIRDHSKAIWNHTASYSEAVKYGRSLAKAIQVVIAVFSIVGGAVKLGAKTVSLIKSAADDLKFSPNALDRVYKGGKNPCNCFTAGTKVLTDEGEKPIEDIVVGDKVLSRNEETGEQAYKEVTHLYRNNKEIIYELTVGDQVIETTDNHPFWVEGKGWVLAVDLQVGDKLQQSNGNTLTIDSIKIVKHDELVRVYNFSVANFHTYFVSDLGIWVHNIGKCDWSVIAKYFTPNAKKHILEGEINSKGKAVGWHHELSSSIGKIVNITVKPNKQGVYAAQVKINGVLKDAESTFFPKHWSSDEVMQAIYEVYENAKPSLKKDGTEFVRKWEGTHSSGIKIQMWLDSEGRVETAFPIL
ncbi:hypothetical protein PAECIP111893_02757 [Paenibacillus plantiphilus]|uniref:SLH domain-containing protein n=1 Tax=Paenibacillus plantiphilus TaxID=2905650 RepID=A0ABN8GHF8_9BACL|nr:S-layer homology domain-containing protein [Paenibacillus plantiphilus]CAH1207692.1 hypothetical protein PAECIP111893_02757 [Paenibacillus plantiphilus]